MKIKKIYFFFNKLAIYCFSIARILRLKILKPLRTCKNIVIVFGQSLGDNVMFLDALRHIRKYYSRQSGYNIYLVGFSNVIDFYEKCTDCDADGYICADRDFSFNPVSPRLISYFKLLSKINKYKPEIVINNFNSVMSVAITAGIVCREKFALSFNITGVRTTFLLRYIRDNCANNIVKIGDFEMLFSGYKKLLRSIGVPDYKTQLGKINKHELSEAVRRKFNIYNPYCVVVTDSNEQPKNWEINNFIEVSKFIINEMNLDIIYTGNHRENRLCEFVNDKYYQKHITDCIGKTNLEELLQIVSDAVFVFGNDSGTIHMAAVLGTRSFFVSTYKDIGRCHPYQLEQINDGDQIPIGIWCKDQPKCAKCNITPSAGKKIIWRNKQCEQNFRMGKSLKCLGDIRVQDVTEILSCKIQF